MADDTPVADLQGLPKPKVIQELDYETLVSELLTAFLDYWNAKRVDNPDLPEFTTQGLESEPLMALVEAYAYRELLLRARINEAARANLLAFAAGSDLDHLTAWLGIERMEGESDARLRRRYQLASYGRSAGGPKERYMAIAFGADVNVRDVAIWREGRDPTTNVAVLSAVGNGDASQGLLNTVQEALEKDDSRVVSDRFNVVSAVRKVVDVEINIRLSLTASETIADTVAATIQSKWAEQDLLGLDLTQAFLIDASLIAGVTDADVVEPAADVVAEENEAIAINNVTVVIRGRGR